MQRKIRKHLDKSEYAKFIGTSLKLAREYHKISVEEVAKYLNRNPVLIESVEKGKMELYIDDFVKMCNLYKIDMDSLSISFFHIESAKENISKKLKKQELEMENLELDLLNTALNNENFIKNDK